MEILSAGEKIKKLRCDLGLKQDDITNEEVTKSLVSMIENNKRSLSWKTAKIISGCLNRYYSNLGKEITPEYLMETEVEQARKIIEEEIDNMTLVIKEKNVDEKLINRSFEKMMDLANSWDLQKEVADLKLLKGDHFYHSYQYNKGLKLYSDALEFYLGANHYETVARIYNRIGNCYFSMLLVEQALIYYTKAYETAVEHNTTNKEKVKAVATLNLILCYRSQQKYDLALQYIATYKDMEFDDPANNQYLDQVLLFEANSHRDLKNYERAEKLYQRLLNRKNKLKTDTLFLLYDNFSELCRDTGNIEKSLELIDKAFELKDQVEENYIPYLYLQQAKCYMALGEGERVLPILNKGLVLSEKVDKKSATIDIHFAIIQVYISIKDYEKALSHLHKAEKIIRQQHVIAKMNELYSFYVEIYMALDEKEKLMDYLGKMRGDYLH